MSGNSEGGQKARITNLAKDPDYYKKIGAKGGVSGKTGGFYYAKYILGDDEHAREAGRKGGLVSRRTRQSKEVDFGPDEA